MAIFLFVRHGEPDYAGVGEWKKVPLGEHFAGLTKLGIVQIEKASEELSAYPVELILSSPYTRAMQSAAIMAKNLGVDVFVEQGLHEWEADLSHTVSDEEELLKLCREHDSCNGIYPEGEIRLWESKEALRKRVLECMSRYADRECVVIAGHAMMMKAVLEIEEPIPYGSIFNYTHNLQLVPTVALVPKQLF